MKIQDFFEFKNLGKKITMVTCYDFWSAQIIENSPIDAILVGDSVAMVVYGHSTTLAANTEMISTHLAAVARGAPKKFIVADMPFPTFRSDISAAMKCVDALMKSGAHAVKVEGVWGHEQVIQHIVGSGVPVMGHLGLIPQSIHSMGGYKVQGREKESAEDLYLQAKKLEDLGCFSLVLECLPQSLAQRITQNLNIPTIGIGAGPFTDGQILVLQDMLGMNKSFQPKFLKQFLNGSHHVETALIDYDREVKSHEYPGSEHSYD